MAEQELPFIDRHDVVVRATPARVWAALPSVLPGGSAAELYTRVIAADPARASGRVPERGATIPGFRVTDAVPAERLVLTGRHAFSRYVLTFTLDAAHDGTLLSALTHAEFPGPHGFAYRTVVIGSGAHARLVPRMLRAVQRRAEG